MRTGAIGFASYGTARWYCMAAWIQSVGHRRGLSRRETPDASSNRSARSCRRALAGGDNPRFRQPMRVAALHRSGARFWSGGRPGHPAVSWGSSGCALERLSPVPQWQAQVSSRHSAVAPLKLREFCLSGCRVVRFRAWKRRRSEDRRLSILPAYCRPHRGLCEPIFPGRGRGHPTSAGKTRRNDCTRYRSSISHARLQNPCTSGNRCGKVAALPSRTEPVR
jgi:hypothetical protein